MKNFGFVCRLALTLLVITSLVAAALAGVNALTKDKIAAAKSQKIMDAVARVLPGNATPMVLSGDTGMVVSAYQNENGYAVEVAPAGFGGNITMMVGISKEFTVTGIEIISHSETAGLGAVAAEDSAKGAAFRDGFIGQSGTLALKKDGGTVEAITGATITSKAVTDGINQALAFVKEVA